MPLNYAGINEDVSPKRPLSIELKREPVANNYAEEVVYPESDGKPMGETGIYVIVTLRVFSALRRFFRHTSNVYVAADMFWYYEAGNPRANKSPDVMVIKGVDNHERRVFKTWEEQAVPCVIIEVTSKSTITEDLFNKGVLYASLGVREYFLFDPLQEYLKQSLLGFTLVDQKYAPIPANEDGSMMSKELGLLLQTEGYALRVIDPSTGQTIPDLDDAIERAEQAEQWAEQEAQRAEQEAQRAEQEAQRAEQEAQRAEQEAQRAEQERRRAEAAEAELTSLRALLERK
jgi:Uma2 family endonuclease